MISSTHTLASSCRSASKATLPPTQRAMMNQAFFLQLYETMHSVHNCPHRTHTAFGFHAKRGFVTASEIFHINDADNGVMWFGETKQTSPLSGYDTDSNGFF